MQPPLNSLYIYIYPPQHPLNYLSHVTSASPLAASPPRLRAKAMPCGASKRSHKSWIPWTSSGAWSWHTKITDSHWGLNWKIWVLGIFGWSLDGIFFLVFWWAIFGSLILKQNTGGFLMWCFFWEEPLQVLNRKMEEWLEMREAINPQKKICVTLKEKAPWYLFKTFLWWLSDPVKG